jgi:hypothetical protein
VTTSVKRSAPNAIGQAARAIVRSYPSAPAGQTAAAIALLALWTLDAVEHNGISREEADRVFSELDVGIGDEPSGPELPEDVYQLVTEGEAFHHYGDEWGTNPAFFRELALSILRTGTGHDHRHRKLRTRATPA